MIVCPIFFMWLAAPGDVDYYQFLVDGVVQSQGPLNRGETCITDRLVHTFQVLAVGKDEDGHTVIVPGDQAVHTIQRMINAGPVPEWAE